MTAPDTLSVLLYGFEPFDKLAVNPSTTVIEQVSDILDKRHNVEKQVIPVTYADAVNQVINRFAITDPHLAVGVGTGPVSRVQVEALAVNVANQEKPDADDTVKRHEPVYNPEDRDAAVAYRSTADPVKLRDRLRSQDIPATVSYVEDTYVCNAAYYTVLRHIYEEQGKRTDAVFFHVPLPPAEINRLEEDRPSFPPEQVGEAIGAALQSYIEEEWP